jgi:hypothetical protein
MGDRPKELAKEAKEETSFSTKRVHWAFGLKTASSTSQRIVNNVLCALTCTCCYVLLDDIVIYAKSLSEHDEKLKNSSQKSVSFPVQK